MKTIGNILWFLLGGFIGGIMWVLAGLVCCITVVGIPLGMQCFKFASLSCMPFGKDIVYGGGAVSFLANLLWIVFLGWEMCLHYLTFGVLWCITIVGIPVGMQSFKMAKLSLMPFGADIVNT